jgi:hypothetical protein
LCDKLSGISTGAELERQTQIQSGLWENESGLNEGINPWKKLTIF